MSELPAKLPDHILDPPADPACQWFAVRAFNRKLDQLKREAEDAHYRTYYAMTTSKRVIQGRTRWVRRPLIPSLFFICCPLEWIQTFKRGHFGDAMVYGNTPSQPSPISEDEMRMFVFVTTREAEVTVAPVVNWAAGDRVRVTDGDFKGAEGVIKRIKKDRKLLVAITGVAVVVLPHIPSEYLEKI